MNNLMTKTKPEQCRRCKRLKLWSQCKKMHGSASQQQVECLTHKEFNWVPSQSDALKRWKEWGVQHELYNKLIFDVSKVSAILCKSIRPRSSCPRTFKIQKVMHFAPSFLFLSRFNLLGVYGCHSRWVYLRENSISFVNVTEWSKNALFFTS